MRSGIALIAIALLAGCDDPSETFVLDPSRWVMMAAEGDSTVAQVEEEFPVGVQLLQSESNGAMSLRARYSGIGADATVPLGFQSVPDQLVCFAGKPGAGDPLNSCDMSDSLGVALVRWRLGRLANRPGEWFWIAAFTEVDGAIVATDTMVAQARPGASEYSAFLHSQQSGSASGTLNIPPCFVRDKYGNPVPYRLNIPAFAHTDGYSIVADSVGSAVVQVFVGDTLHAEADLEVTGSEELVVKFTLGRSYMHGLSNVPACPREGY